VDAAVRARVVDAAHVPVEWREAEEGRGLGEDGRGFGREPRVVHHEELARGEDDEPRGEVPRRPGRGAKKKERTPAMWDLA